MKPSPIPETVLRAREIHRQRLRIPRVSELVDMRAVAIGNKSRRVAARIRDGLMRRGIVQKR